MVIATCRHCRKSFQTYPIRVKQGKAAFCTRACYGAWMSVNVRGDAHPMKGRKHSAASLRKMRETKLATSPRGPDNPRWKGGRHMSRGYVMVALSLLPEREQKLFASMATLSGNHYIPEHRLVVARKLGRPLMPTEVVHHRNGNKQDNRYSNLEIQDPKAHTRNHQDVLRELKRLRRENELLKSELSKFWNRTSREDG